MRAADALTRGYLPASAFTHLDSTHVGVVDLECGTEPRSPSKRSLASDRDGILLVRMHGEPLGVIHVAPQRMQAGASDLAQLICQSLEPQLRSHVRRWGCAQLPKDPRSLVASVLGRSCAGKTPADPGGAVAVIIPTVGRVEQLSRCLGSILAVKRSGVEVIVVDNRPGTPDTHELVAQLGFDDPRLRYVTESRPGVSVARNRGISETDAQYVAFTDDDVVVDDRWLEWLLSPFAQPRVAAVTGMVLPLELETPAQKRFEQYAGFSRGVSGRLYDMSDRRADDRVLYPYWGGMFGSGNNMAFRRAELVAAGGFDPRLGPGSPAHSGEDTDAMSATILSGHALAYEPRALLWHEHRRDDEALRRQLFNYGVGFTAGLTKALTTDPRFLFAAARTVPLALKLRRKRRKGPAQARAAELPSELARLEWRGMLRGPGLYARSALRARRLRLKDVVRGS